VRSSAARGPSLGQLVQHPVQRVAQRLGQLLADRVAIDRDQLALDVGRKPTEWIVAQALARVVERLVGEQVVVRAQQLVEHGPQAVHVAGGDQHAGRDLLGLGVVWGPDQHVPDRRVGAHRRARIPRAREPEVDHLARVRPRGDPQVLGLEIPMHDAHLVGLVEPDAGLVDDPNRPRGVHRLLEVVVVEQGLALEQLHDHEPPLILAHAVIEDVHDIGVAQVLEDPDLPQRPDRHGLFGDRRARELERDRAREVRRGGREHPREPTATEDLDDLEFAVVVARLQLELFDDRVHCGDRAGDDNPGVSGSPV
jgi:hypothetical protein